MELIWVNVSSLSSYQTAKGKDPVKPHVKLGEPLTLPLPGANVGVETLDVMGTGMKDYLVRISLYPTLRRINRTSSSLRAGSGAGTDSVSPSQ